MQCGALKIVKNFDCSHPCSLNYVFRLHVINDYEKRLCRNITRNRLISYREFPSMLPTVTVVINTLLCQKQELEMRAVNVTIKAGLRRQFQLGDFN